MESQDWTFWQLADSAFPAGGFAHSAGLESAWRHGRVTSPATLAQFLDALVQDSARGLLPLMLAVHSGSESLAQADEWADAFLVNEVANRASRVQGRSFLAASEAAFQHEEIQSLRDRINEHTLHGHHAPLAGWVTGLVALPRKKSAAWYLFAQVRDVVSAATRLNIVGPLAGQSLLTRMSRFVLQEAEKALDRPGFDMEATSPLLEIVATRHDRLYSRLFQS